MAALDISEYMDSSHGTPIEPPVAHQVLALGTEPAQSKPFHKGTRIVRLVADVACRVGFGDAPVSLLPAGREMTRIIHPDSGFRLTAVIAGEDGQISGVDSLTNAAAFFELLSNPAKGKALLDKLIKARDEALAARAALGDTQTKTTALTKEKGLFATAVAAEQEKLKEAGHRLDARSLELQEEQKKHVAAVAAFATERAEFEKIRSDLETRLGDFERLRKVLAA